MIFSLILRFARRPVVRRTYHWSISQSDDRKVDGSYVVTIGRLNDTSMIPFFITRSFHFPHVSLHMHFEMQSILESWCVETARFHWIQRSSYQYRCIFIACPGWSINSVLCSCNFDEIPDILLFTIRWVRDIVTLISTWFVVDSDLVKSLRAFSSWVNFSGTQRHVLSAHDVSYYAETMSVLYISSWSIQTRYIINEYRFDNWCKAFDKYFIVTL